MALTSANASAPLDLPYSTGKMRVQHKVVTVLTGDVAGTVTFDGLTRVVHVEVQGLTLTAAPTYATNVATLAFDNTLLATVSASIVAYGV